MILEGLMKMMFSFFSFILKPIHIPSAPEDIATSMPKFLEYLEYGVSFFNLVIPVNILPFFVVFLVMFSWNKLYPVIMWVLKKIPFLGIE